MTDIVRLEDTDGRIHFTARESKAAETLLAAGATDLDTPREVTDAPTDATPADGDDTGNTDGGPGQRKRASRRTAGGDRGEGVAEPEVDG